MPIELIIFDLDGTLVDSCKDITQALNYCFEKKASQVFQEMKYERWSEKELIDLIRKSFRGKGNFQF